jgi:arabinose-5-phosphate isomerase
MVVEGRKVFDMEITALREVESKLDRNFAEAIKIIIGSPGKVVFIGVGKSGLVACMIASSFRSTGIPAVYVNGSDALHGDLGICAPGDAVVLISNGGVTSELLQMLPTLRNQKSPIIAIVGNPSSPLAKGADVVLNAQVAMEADPLDLVPTSSATAALVLGHALIAVIMRANGFSKEQFAAFHPSGLLGRSLNLKVGDVMHTGEQIPRVVAGTSIKDVIIEISAKALGATCVLNEGERLDGLITDGDIRRMLQTYDDVRPITAEIIMTSNPITVGPDTLIGDALKMMEQRTNQLSVLPVVDPNGACIGLLRLHDIVRAETI